MPSLAELQRDFVAALHDAPAPPPAGLRGRGDELPAKRFDVYRNNVYLSLATALASTFPTVERLVGERFFRDMARAHVARELPRTPVLIHYGDRFADFVAGFVPASTVPYLADVARLEWAWHCAYHAAEAEPLAAEALAAVAPEDTGALRFGLHPSLSVVRSDWPVLAIVEAHRSDPPATVDLAAGGQDVLVVRPEAEVVLRHLPPGAPAFIDALGGDVPLGAAAATAAQADSRFDLARNLQGLLASGALTGCRVDPHQQGATA